MRIGGEEDSVDRKNRVVCVWIVGVRLGDERRGTWEWRKGLGEEIKEAASGVERRG